MDTLAPRPRRRFVSRGALLASVLSPITCALVACSSTPAAPGGSANDGAFPCNGHVELCDRRFDQVVFPATHNSYSAEEYGFGSLFANQTSGIEKQLADGIRGMLLDVYDDPDGHMLCHASCGFAETSHARALATLKQFLTDHPHEVVTLDYEDHLPASGILDDLNAAGLGGMLHAQDPQAPWPTLRAMISPTSGWWSGSRGSRPPSTSRAAFTTSTSWRGTRRTRSASPPTSAAR